MCALWTLHFITNQGKKNQGTADFASCIHKNMIKYGCSVVASWHCSDWYARGGTKPYVETSSVEISHCYAHVEQIYSTETHRTLGHRHALQFERELGKVNNEINQQFEVEYPWQRAIGFEFGYNYAPLRTEADRILDINVILLHFQIS